MKIINFPNKNGTDEEEINELSHLSISFRDDNTYLIKEERGLEETTILLNSHFDLFKYLREII